MVAALPGLGRGLAICVAACEAWAKEPASRFLAVGGEKTFGGGGFAPALPLDSLRASRSFRAASSRRWMASRSTSSSSSSMCIGAREAWGPTATALLAAAAAAAGFWKTRRFCTASNAAIGRLWVWGVSHIALPSWSASPPHAPQTHGRVQTQLNQRAGCACADPVPRNAAHACRAPAEVRTQLLPRCWTRIRARERWRGERYRQTPGDHATNLGDTMLNLATRGSAGLSSSEEPGALRPLRALRFSLLRRSLWGSSLHMLHAPQS